MRSSDADSFSDDCSVFRSPTNDLPTGATTAFDTTALSISFVDFDVPGIEYKSDSSSQSPPTISASNSPLRSPVPSPPRVPPEPMPRHVHYRIAVCRWAPLVLPVGLLGTLIFMLVSDLTTANSAGSSSGSSFPVVITDWNECELESSAASARNLGAQCTLLALPLCHDSVCSDPDNHTINVFIKRIRAASDSATTSVWYIPDRPDAQTTSEADNQMALLYEQLNGTTSVYRMDMRGAGHSSPLVCSVDLASSVFNPKQLPTLSEVQQCAEDVRALYGDRLSAFSLTSAAHDLKMVIETYQTDTASVGDEVDIVVYALGYGTHIAQRMMRLETDGVVGYVLDSPLATADAQISFSVSKADADFGEVGDAFLAWCMDDAGCSEKFPDTSLTNVSATLEATFVRLDAGTGCSKLFSSSVADSSSRSDDNISAASGSSSASSATSSTSPSYNLRKQLAVLMESAALRPLVPVLAYRVNRCGSEDIGVLERLSRSLANTIEERTDSLELVHAIQAFSELWEAPSPDQAELLERFESSQISNGQAYDKLVAYCLFTGDSSSACNGVTTAGEQLLGFERDSLGTANVSLRASTSVLVLSGDMDGLAPSKYAKALQNSIQGGGGKQLLVVANGTHNIIDTAVLPDGSSCGRQVLVSFVQSNGNMTAVDSSCFDELLPANLAVSSSLSALVLNVTDAYDGELGLSSSSSDVDGESLQPSSSSAASMQSANSSSTDAQIDSLTSSRNRYKVALIAVGSVSGSLAVMAVALALYRRHQKRELAKEEELLRRMRGSADDDFDLLRGLYLSSFSYRTNSSGES